MTLKRKNKAVYLIDKKMQYVEEINHFSHKRPGTEVSDKIKDARKCGYAQMEELRCVFFSRCSLRSIESKYVSHREQQEHEPIMSTTTILWSLVKSKTIRSHEENYRNEEISGLKAAVVI